MAESSSSDQPNSTGPRVVPLELTLGPAEGVPLLYANGVNVNYLGNEFLVSVFVAVPEPFLGGQRPNTNVEGKILARFMFTPQAWVNVMESLNSQLTALRSERVPLPEPQHLEA